MEFCLKKICDNIGIDCPEQGENIKIKGVSSIEYAGPDDLSFLSNPKYEKYLKSTQARAVIVPENLTASSQAILLPVKDPYFAFLRILELFNSRKTVDIASGIDPSAYIHQESVIGENVSIGPCAVIGPGVKIGDGSVIGPCTVILSGSTVGKDCILYPNVTVMDGCFIGNNVILHAGVVIGSDGFGFVPHEGRILKIPQIGCVRIEDDVEIGANTCIDRAVTGETVIAKGTKLDNLIQVAHNVRIGSQTVIASQAGISGSTRIGKGVRIGGQAGIIEHLNIGDGASIGGQAGLMRDVLPGESVSGSPAKNHRLTMRIEAILRKLPQLLKTVNSQEKRIQRLELRNKKRP